MSRTSKALLVILLALPAARVQAQEARLDYSSPVVRQEMDVLVDRLAPGTTVALRMKLKQMDSARIADTPFVEVAVEVADASGCARFEVPVPAEFAGQTWWLQARLPEGGRFRELEGVPVRFQWPQIVVTGTENGRAVGSRLYATDSLQRPFVEAERWSFGPGRPGGAVRDARGTRTFIVTDAENGRLAVYRDGELGGGLIAEWPIPRDVRGITITPDGRYVLVTSAGAGSESYLTILDAGAEQSDQIMRSQILLDPLGPVGGKIAVGPGGLRAFVSVRGVFLREVDLLAGQPGALVTVGGAAQEVIRDLRIVDGFLYALTARGDQVTYLTGLELGNLGDLGNLIEEGPDLNVSSIGVSSVRGHGALLLLNGEGGKVTVIDTETMQRTGDLISVQPGALALLLSPDPVRSSGALLYASEGGGSELRPIGFDLFDVGEPVPFPFRARPLPVFGVSEQVDWFFLAGPGGRAFVVDPDSLRAIYLGLSFQAHSVSVSR
ncbi:MAG: hypothetical protein V2A76_09675 [Planctomycetota bacterium]